MFLIILILSSLSRVMLSIFLFFLKKKIYFKSYNLFDNSLHNRINKKSVIDLMSIVPLYELLQKLLHCSGHMQ